MEKKSAILIVGVGNTLRGDDGIGAYICHAIDKLGISSVSILVIQQLQTEQVEEFLTYDHVVIADATISGESVKFLPLDKEDSKPVSTSHHVNADLLASLAEQLYQQPLSIMICAVKGESFEMSELLSPLAKQNADQAISIICSWIGKGCR